MALRPLRTAVLGLVAAAFAGAAAASDYFVVASTDPAIVRGRAFNSGERAPLAPGATLTLMHASGDVVTLRGVQGGAVVPSRRANQADADRLALLKVLVAPAVSRMTGATRVRTRGGVCPEAASLADLDAIANAATACEAEASEAFEAWLVAHPAPAA
jgi:hypothetical protein